MKDKKNKNGKNWLIYMLLGGFIIKAVRSLFRSDKADGIKENVTDFLKAEKKEIYQLSHGQESIGKYCHDSGSIFKDFFIPTKHNGHKPRILRTHSLVIIFVIAVLVKAAITGYMFFVYPNEARMEESMIKEILSLTNGDRAVNNVGQLSLNTALSAAANAKAEDMLTDGYFAHYSPDGKKPWDWIVRDKYAYLFVGENLAMDFTSAKSVHDALMQSPTHKKNILNGTYKDIGLAVVTGELNGHKTNVLVELFASRKEASLAITPPADHTAGTSEVIAAKAPATTISAPVKKQETISAPTTAAKPASSKNTKTISIAPKPAIAATADNPVAKPASTTSVSDTVASTTPQPSEPLRYGLIARTGTPTEISPNIGLEENRQDDIVFVASTESDKAGLAGKLAGISRYMLLGLVALLILALLANILIEITVQHKPVIIQTVFLIILITGLATSHFHVLEQIARKVALI